MWVFGSRGHTHTHTHTHTHKPTSLDFHRCARGTLACSIFMGSSIREDIHEIIHEVSWKYHCIRIHAMKSKNFSWLELCQ